MSDAASAALLSDLRRADAEATAIARRGPLGVRAVERSPGSRHYLVAFDDSSFLCLGSTLAVEPRAVAVREVASVSILWERVESEVAGDRLRALAAAAGRVLVAGVPDGVGDAVQLVAQRALELAEWRERPERAIATLTGADEAIQLQEALYRAFDAFVRRSQPLVERQSELAGDLVDALRAFEESAAAAGAATRLAGQLADALPGCHEQADQIVAGHIVPLA